MVRARLSHDWVANVLDDSIELENLRELLADWESAPPLAAPRWFLFGEALLRFGRLRGLLTAASVIGADLGRASSTGSSTIEHMGDTLGRVARDPEIPRALRHNLDRLVGPRPLASDHVPRADPIVARLRRDLRLAMMNYASQTLAISFHTNTEAVTWMNTLQTLSDLDRKAIVERARNRKAAYLLLTGISDNEPATQILTNAIHGALMRVDDSSQNIRAYVDAVLGHPVRRSSADNRGRTIALVERLDTIVTEGGYDSLLEIIHGAGLGRGSLGRDWPSGDINVIPSSARGGCCPIVLATIRGKKGSLSFRSVLRQVSTLLYDCKGVTQTVIVLSDYWDAEELSEEHEAKWRSAAAAKVSFLVFLVGASVRGLSPVHVNLE